ncbi:MAG: transcription-repair coupling factor [Anaerolineales bacterium]|nr:transcription-repair coupling factor [Anaerolineales bacterium]
MNLSALLPPVRSLHAYQQLVKDVQEHSRIQASLGLPRSVRPLTAAALVSDLQRPVVYLIPRDDRVLTLAEELAAWAPDLHIMTFPEPNPVFYETAPWGAAVIRRRVQTLAALTESRQPGSLRPERIEPLLILASAKSVMTSTLAPRMFIRHGRWMQTGLDFEQARLIQLLNDIGYAHTSIVVAPGQFSRRGGIVDLWPPAALLPIRLEYFGNEIDSMRSFSPSTQRSAQIIDHFRLTPAREALPVLLEDAWKAHLAASFEDPPDSLDPYLETLLPWVKTEPSGLLSYLAPEGILLIEDVSAFEDAVQIQEEQALVQRGQLEAEGSIEPKTPLPYLTLNDIQDQINDHSSLDLGYFSDPLPATYPIADSFQPGPRFSGQLQSVLDSILEKQLAHETVIVISRQSPRLTELWRESGDPVQSVETLPDHIEPGSLHFVQGTITEGWTLTPPVNSRIHLLTDAEIFGWSRPIPRRRPTRVAAAPESIYSDLNPGDLIVHVDFGIGEFAGLVERTLDNVHREFFLIHFGGGDQLFVPIHQADRISRYLGAGNRPPTLSRLGSQEWIRTRRRAEEATEEVARDMLELYAARHSVEGVAYAPDTAWQQELEASFAYHETEDQVTALKDVKRDLESPRPMDRLICGDVGYGKTEVALRAAFKAVMNGKQVAFLVPTTVLAQQHYQTFLRRLAAFPVEIEMLSRFRSQREVNQILTRLASGDVDIVIGTHRLLQPDVSFKDLGLLVVDEEQRFGVTHKEFLKKMRTEVDVLTLTATPIPRTLYLALTGTRDISNINTPPEERLPVITNVGTYNPRIVRQAVLREVDRGGQVFFVHNRVQTIRAIASQLEKLVPEARFAIAHGQMNEEQLAKTMDRFHAGEIDVMVSTSIIESGLDIPNANTLIIDRADLFGLSQLYQLRGRVGRGAQQAYAYLFLHPRFHATEEARQRLEVLAENTRLGSGYAISMRDLEMRGAGDILGVRQHGHISAIGFHLYTRLLTQAVQRLKGEYNLAGLAADNLPSIQALPVSLDLPLPSAIPETYISDQALRLKLYRRLADQRSLEELGDVVEEMKDRFGPPPEEVANLLYQMRIKLRAARAGIRSIAFENGQFLFQFIRTPILKPMQVVGTLRQSKRGIWFRPAENPDWTDQLETIVLELEEQKTAGNSGR